MRRDAPDARRERFGNVRRMRAERDAHARFTVVDDAGRERDDLDERLRVEQQEHPGDSVGE